jgi:hypothetical protein
MHDAVDDTPGGGALKSHMLGDGDRRVGIYLDGQKWGAG